MLDNALFQLIIPQLTAGFTNLGLSVVIKQKNQPTQQGANTTPTIYLYKVSDRLRGSPYVNNTWNQTNQAIVTGSITGNVFTVTAVSSGTVGIGQTLTNGNLGLNLWIVGKGTGAGATGTYILNNSLSMSSQTFNLIAGEVFTTMQQYETTFQASSLAYQDPNNSNALTASDYLNYASYILQNQTFITAIEAQGVGVLKIENARNIYFKDDADRFEANPSFDFTLTHKQTIISVQPVVTKFAFKVYRI